MDSESPVTHLLCTNCIPTDHQIRQIQPFISQCETNLRLLNAQIVVTQATLEDQLREHSDLREQIEAYKALLSPARRLPNDILTEIFLRCLPGDRYPGFGAREAPSLLTNVCRGWRNLALSIPHLWSAFHISPTSTSPVWRTEPVLYRPRIKAVKAWLTRSGGYPLSISLLAQRDASGFERAILAVLVQHAHRWKDVHFKMNSDMFHLLSNLNSQSVPLLRYISLDVAYHRLGAGRSSFQWEVVPFLQAAPRLQCVVVLSVASYNPVLPWEQLTHLCMTSSHFRRGLEPPEALKVLRACPQLKSCRFTMVAPVSTAQDNINIDSGHLITMPFLGSLHLRASNDGAPAFLFLVQLDLPSLQDLGIDAHTDGWESVAMAEAVHFGRQRIPSHINLMAFLSRAAKRLKRLSFNGVNLNKYNLIQCLILTPNLVELSYQEALSSSQLSPIPETLLKLLTLTPRSTDPFTNFTSGIIHVHNPDLESITIRSRFAVPDAAILDFVRSRWERQLPGVARLKSALFRFERDNPTEERRAGVGVVNDTWSDPGTDSEEDVLFNDCVALKDLRKKGLNVAIVCGSVDVLADRDQRLDTPQRRGANREWWLKDEVREWVGQ